MCYTGCAVPPGTAMTVKEMPRGASAPRLPPERMSMSVTAISDPTTAQRAATIYERAHPWLPFTHDVRVEVLSQYSSEHSHPLDGEWVFQYTVRITNQSDETVQLISRHWIITDALEHVEEVQGPGVVGEQPVLAPGQSFKYSSWCPLPTQTGMMRGTYQMLRTGGDQFDIEIAPFALRAKQTVH